VGSNHDIEKKYLMIEVTDNGSGIPKDILNKVFKLNESDTKEIN